MILLAISIFSKRGLDRIVVMTQINLPLLWLFEYTVWEIENCRNLCSLLVTSLSGINNTFTPLCHSTIISENWTSRRVTIQTLDVQYMTHLCAIVYPGPEFYHLAPPPWLFITLPCQQKCPVVRILLWFSNFSILVYLYSVQKSRLYGTE